MKHIERILRVVNGFADLNPGQRDAFTYFWLGMLTAFVHQHPGLETDELVDDLVRAAELFGISSAPAEVSKLAPGAGASELLTSKGSEP